MTRATQGHALVLGAGGQDGVYLTRSLLRQGWRVTGVVRDARAAARLHSLPRADYVACDLTHTEDLRRVIDAVPADHVYNLAGFSSVAESWRNRVACHEVNAVVACNTMAIVHSKMQQTGSEIRLFQASSGEMFGAHGSRPRSESMPMKPLTPYGAAKMTAHLEAQRYRTLHGHHFVSGILYNHESPLRPARFVTRKVSLAAAAIARGQGSAIPLGNVDTVRDWGHASDYVEAMVLMMATSAPDDYVIASGIGRSVIEMARAFLSAAGIADTDDWIRADAEPRRPIDLQAMVGDPRRIRTRLGWEPRISFERLVEEMVAHDVAVA